MKVQKEKRGEEKKEKEENGRSGQMSLSSGSRGYREELCGKEEVCERTAMKRVKGKVWEGNRDGEAAEKRKWKERSERDKGRGGDETNRTDKIGMEMGMT